MAQKSKEITLHFPIKGINLGQPSDAQPQMTTPDCKNVWAYNRDARSSGGVRSGTSKLVTTQFGNGGWIQGIGQAHVPIRGPSTAQVDFLDTIFPEDAPIDPTDSATISTCYDNLSAAQKAYYNSLAPDQFQTVVAAGGLAYAGSAAGFTQVTSGTASIDPGRRLTLIGTSLGVWIIGGGDDPALVQFDGTTGAASFGTPTAGYPTRARIGCLWRGRLLLSGTTTDPHNIFASNVGITSWDTSVVADDAAWALNASTAGRIGDPVSALMPFSDDTLLIGGYSTLWRLDGDPAAGGSLSLISNSLGVWSKDAWCQGPDGAVFFFGGGAVYRYATAGGLQNITDARIKSLMPTMPSDGVYLVFDIQHVGVWFIVGDPSPLASKFGIKTVLFYDLRNDAWFPMEFSDAAHPSCAVTWLDDSQKPQVILGNTTGYLYKLDDTIATDDTDLSTGQWTAIESYAYLGPVQPAGQMHNAKALQANVAPAQMQGAFVSADHGFNLTLQARTGPSRQNDQVTGTSSMDVIGTRTQIIRPRLTGNAFYAKVSGITQSETYEESATTTMDNHVVWLNGGDDLPAGIYRLYYTSGAVGWNASLGAGPSYTVTPPSLWAIRDSNPDHGSVFIVSQDATVTWTAGTSSVVSATTKIEISGPTDTYALQADAETAYADTFTEFYWPGGKMGIVGTNKLTYDISATFSHNPWQVAYLNNLYGIEYGSTLDPTNPTQLTAMHDYYVNEMSNVQRNGYNALAMPVVFDLICVQSAPKYPVWAMDRIALNVVEAGRVRVPDAEAPAATTTLDDLSGDDGLDDDDSPAGLGSLSGYVYIDENNNSIKDGGEPGIGGVIITLTGTTNDGRKIVKKTATDSSGHYAFNRLSPGTYAIAETQPAAYGDGADTIGSLGGSKKNDYFYNIVVGAGQNGTNYNFGEMPHVCVDITAYTGPLPATLTIEPNVSGTNAYLAEPNWKSPGWLDPSVRLKSATSIAIGLVNSGLVGNSDPPATNYFSEDPLWRSADDGDEIGDMVIATYNFGTVDSPEYDWLLAIYATHPTITADPSNLLDPGVCKIAWAGRMLCSADGGPIGRYFRLPNLDDIVGAAGGTPAGASLAAYVDVVATP